MNPMKRKTQKDSVKIVPSKLNSINFSFKIWKRYKSTLLFIEKKLGIVYKFNRTKKKKKKTNISSALYERNKKRLSSLVDILSKKGFKFKGKKVLDFGAGKGVLGEVLKTKDVKYYAVEVDKNDLAILREKKFKVFSCLRRVNEKFDYIFIIQSLQYFDNIKLLPKFEQLLMPHGAIFVEILNPFSYYNLISDFINLNHTLKLPSNMYYFPYSTKFFHLFFKKETYSIRKEFGTKNEILHSKLLIRILVYLIYIILKFMHNHHQK